MINKKLVNQLIGDRRKASKALMEIIDFLRNEAERRELKMRVTQEHNSDPCYDVGLDVGAYEATVAILFTAAKIIKKRIK